MGSARGSVYVRRVSIDVAETDPQGREGARGPTGEGSRGRTVSRGRIPALLAGSQREGLVVLALGVIGGLLLVIAEFLTVASVDVAAGACEVINDANPQLADRCALSGLERHGGAFILLGVVIVLMALGAGPGRSRPAAVALMVIGAVVVAIALISDLPVTGETGPIGDNFEGAKGVKGPGLFLEVIAALIAAGAGLLALLRRE